MTEEKKIVHIAVIGGNQKEIADLGQLIRAWKEEKNLNYEFIISNESVQLQSTEFLLRELWKLHEEDKKLKMRKKSKVKK